jgi:hypothetical protein
VLGWRVLMAMRAPSRGGRFVFPTLTNCGTQRSHRFPVNSIRMLWQGPRPDAHVLISPDVVRTWRSHGSVVLSEDAGRRRCLRIYPFLLKSRPPHPIGYEAESILATAPFYAVILSAAKNLSRGSRSVAKSFAASIQHPSRPRLAVGKAKRRGILRCAQNDDAGRGSSEDRGWAVARGVDGARMLEQGGRLVARRPDPTGNGGRDTLPAARRKASKTRPHAADTRLTTFRAIRIGA